METFLKLCTDEQTEKLRKIGFEWTSDTPSVELALKYLRDVKNIVYDGGFYLTGKNYRYFLYVESDLSQKEYPDGCTRTPEFSNYEDALSYVLDFYINLLTKKTPY